MNNEPASLDYEWYDKCECGGEYKDIAGVVFDTYPSSHPVQCKDCAKESRSYLEKHTSAVGWRKPEWKKD